MPETVVIRCFDTGVYTLLFPKFFMEAPKAKLKKIFKWLFQFDRYDENRAAIEFLDTEIPRFSEYLKTERIPETQKAWELRSKEFMDGYRSIDPMFFPSGLNRKEKQTVAATRRKRNKELMLKVKEAKAAHDKAKKDYDHSIEVYGMFKSEK